MTVNNIYVKLKSELESHPIVAVIKAIATGLDFELYVVDRILSERKYLYEQSVIVILAPGHRIILVNCGETQDRFAEFKDDLIDDIGVLSDKYNYKEHIGRPRSWREQVFISAESDADMESVIESAREESPGNKRKIDLIIGLITGSINDINKIGITVPASPIDRIRKKIVLFDGDQTRFIYSGYDCPPRQIIPPSDLKFG